MTLQPFRDQLENPNHVNIYVNGKPLRHRADDDTNPLRGKLLRFTHLAATRVAKQLAGFGRKIELQPWQEEP